MKITALKQIPLLLVCAVFTLAGCFSAWEGDEAALTLHLGGSGSRSAADNFQPEDLYHKITISDASGGVVRERDARRGEMIVRETLTPGRYDIKVEAFSDDNVLVAAGSEESVRIKAGNNTVSITMEWIEEEEDIEQPKIEFNFWDGDEEMVIPISSALNFEISKTGTKQFQEISVVDPDNYDSIEFYMFGQLMSGNNNGSITIYAMEYNTGSFELIVTVFKDDVPYSTKITFEVTP
ncbi:MAG: hypothetical protein FWG99_10620 [Treponema sp.]|nr:hypothetical protein [Treponema sp.]